MFSNPSRYIERVRRYRVSIILLSILITTIVGSGARLLVWPNDYRIYFSDDNRSLLAFEELENAFVRSDYVLFVLEKRDGGSSLRKGWPRLRSLPARAGSCPMRYASIRLPTISILMPRGMNSSSAI